MYKKRYPLEPHGRKRLELWRNADWSDVAIIVDGIELGRTNRDALHEGVDFALRDHSLLRVWIEDGPRGVPFLYLTRNGHPLPGSEGDPAKIIWTTVCVFWCLATAQVFFAVAVLLYGNPEGSIYFIGAAGLVLALLGIMAWMRSYPAMVLASLWTVGELLLFFYVAGNKDPWELWRPVVAIGIVGWMFLRAIDAVRDINATRLPIRHPPELIRPLEHHAPPHPGSQHSPQARAVKLAPRWPSTPSYRSLRGGTASIAAS